jgi:hypothetical protein
MKLFESQNFENINLDEFTLILDFTVDSNYNRKNLLSWKLKDDFESKDSGFFIGTTNNCIEFGIGSLEREDEFVNTRYVPAQFSNSIIVWVYEKEKNSKFFINNVEIADCLLPEIVKGDFILFGDDEKYNYFRYESKINSVEILNRALTKEEIESYIY